MNTYKFEKASHTFFNELRKRVDDYFVTNNISLKGGNKLIFKSVIIISCIPILYVTLIAFTPNAITSIALCMLLGLNFAAVGFNVMHEGGHQAFSKYKVVNEIAAYFLNILGGSIHYWKQKHNVNHHTFTNIEGIDNDIDVKPFMRLHDGQPRYWFHKYQHIYWAALYPLTYLSWIFYEDFEKYFTGKINKESEKRALPFYEHLIFWCTKTIYVGLFIVIPIMAVGWLSWLIGFATITLTTGLAISVVFQLAHVVEATDFHSHSIASTKEWAIHQISTTANFATRSKLLFWLLGGLNFQIEHHLFPRISHIHYPKISQIVKETCEEYNIAYHEYSTMLKAVGSHVLHLKKLGTS
ncbi:MAG: linoleoyl-CoA desaturase [Cyclobacteriaceae bacterium]|jgi:linoleoyl-CoA desaturase